MDAAIERSKDEMHDQGTVTSHWEVLPSESGWLVKNPLEDGVISRHEDREAAVVEAHLLARQARPSHVVVRTEDGQRAWVVEYPVVPAAKAAGRGTGVALLDEDGRPPAVTKRS